MSLGPVMVGVAGLELKPEECEMLKHPLVGGVILFSRNYESVEQIATLIKEIHSIRHPSLLVGVDHEGGRVQRFRSGFTLLPAISLLGKVYDQDIKRARKLAEITAWLMASELRAIGVDFSFAPVLDLDRGISQVIGDRAFHANPEAVADLAHYTMIGMNKAGMAATGKHFPGHGAVKEDSHHAIPVDNRSYEEILLEDMLPFERMIHYGLQAIMVAHVIYQQVDDKLAGFSSFWLNEVLRKRFDFQGVIFSDDLEMEGASVINNVVDRARAALDAGCDMVLVCQAFDAMTDTLDALEGWSNPASQLRLARMHGHNTISYSQLHKDPAWKEAVAIVNSYDEPHTLDLV